MFTLGIETSCDETACGIVDGNFKVLANEIYTQETQHLAYGGVVPEIAARAHLEKIGPVVKAALATSGLGVDDIDLFSFTKGPGLIGPLLVGASFARGLARRAGRQAVGISHLEGHLAAAYLTQPGLKPPFLCLTVSGGHTELCIVKPDFAYKVVGRTRDDAVGEAFDKCGKIMGLAYPAGPRISKLAENGDPDFFRFPMGLDEKGNFDFSYSGVKTAFSRFLQSQPADQVEKNKAHICASLEHALVEILVKKSIRAMKAFNLNTLAICGGVSANSRLRKRAHEETQKRGFKAVLPALSLCTDNGAMVAGIAQMRFLAGKLPADQDVSPSLAWESWA